MIFYNDDVQISIVHIKAKLFFEIFDKQNESDRLRTIDLNEFFVEIFI